MMISCPWPATSPTSARSEMIDLERVTRSSRGLNRGARNSRQALIRLHLPVVLNPDVELPRAGVQLAV